MATLIQKIKDFVVDSKKPHTTFTVNGESYTIVRDNEKHVKIDLRKNGETDKSKKGGKQSAKRKNKK